MNDQPEPGLALPMHSSHDNVLAGYYRALAEYSQSTVRYAVPMHASHDKIE